MFVNNRICFVESSNSNLINTNVDNASPSDMIFYRKNNFPPINIHINQNIYVSLKPGVFSTLSENNLIANNFYMKDDTVKNEGLNSPFDDTKLLGNKISARNNPTIFKQNIGSNCSEDFDDLFTYPFEDINLSLYDRRIPHYRHYVNAYTIQNLGQSISILGNFEEITGKYITESVFKGAHGFMSNRDARGRSVQVYDSFNIDDIFNEEFLDQEITNNSTESGLIKRNFSYEVISVNGEESIVLSVSDSSFSFISALTKKAMFYNEENMSIIPFNDSLTAEEISESIIVTSRGVDNDAAIQENNTIGRLGEID